MLTLAVVLADVGLDEVERDEWLPHLLVELHEQLRTTWPAPSPRLRLGAIGLCARMDDDTASVLRDLSLALQSSQPLAVNVSAASLVVPHFGARVVSLLQSQGVPGDRLSIEVTEVSPVPDIDDVRDNLHHLVSAGVQLSLDDFGTGYSALTLLARFPFNEIKIDQWMVARIDQPRMEAAIAVAIDTAQRYGAALVAEGVETERQWRRLQAMGVRIGQGFLFSRPVALAQLLELSATGTVPDAFQGRGSLAAGTGGDTVSLAMHTR